MRATMTPDGSEVVAPAVKLKECVFPTPRAPDLSSIAFAVALKQLIPVITMQVELR